MATITTKQTTKQPKSVSSAKATLASIAKLATVMDKSGNDKTGEVSATYTPYQTCPDSCELKPIVNEETGEFDKAPCYACHDFVGMTMKRLTRAAATSKATLYQIAVQEATGIESLSGERPLRLKVGGDFPNEKYARRVAQACESYTAKQGKPAYGYSHNWETIPREAFGSISILASCDRIEDIGAAKERGYAIAVVVSEFPNGNKQFMLGGHRVIPCLEQTQGIQCVDCELCFDDQNLIKHDISIGFEAHGRQAEMLKGELQTKGL